MNLPTAVSSLSTDAAPSSLGSGSDEISSSIGIPSLLKPSESVALHSATPNPLQAKGETGLTAAPVLAGTQTTSQQTGLRMPSFLSSTAGANVPSSSLSLGFPSSGGSLSTGSSSLKAGPKEMQPPLPGQLGLNLFGGVTQQNATVSNMQGTQAPSTTATQPGFSFSVSKSTTLPSLSSSGTASFGSLQQQPLSVTQASLFSGQPSQTGASSIGMKLSQLNNKASFKLTSSNGPAQSQTQPVGSSSTLLGGVSAPSFFSQSQQSTGGGSSNLFQLSAASGQNVTGQQPKQGGFQLGGGAKLTSGFSSNPAGGVLSSSQSSQAQQLGQTSSLFSGAGTGPSVPSTSTNTGVFGVGGMGLSSSLAFGASASQLGAVSSSMSFGNQGSVAPSQGGGSCGLFGASGQPGTATPSLQFGAPTGQAQQPALGSNLFQFSADSAQQKQPVAAAPSLQLGQGSFGQPQQQPSGGLKQMNNSNVFGTQSVPSAFNFSAGGGATSQTPALGDGKLNFGAGAAGVGGMAGMGSIQQPAQNSGMSGFTFSGMAQPQQQTQAPSFNFSAMAGAQEQNQAPSFNFSGMGAAQQNTASSFNFSITGSQQQQAASNTGFNFSAVASNAGFQQPNAMGGTAFSFAASQPISSSGAVNFSLGKSRTASNRPRGRRRK